MTPAPTPSAKAPSAEEQRELAMRPQTKEGGAALADLEETILNELAIPGVPAIGPVDGEPTKLGRQLTGNLPGPKKVPA